MRHRKTLLWVSLGLLVICAISLLVPRFQDQLQGQPAKESDKPAADDSKQRQPDREAIVKSSRDFCTAFGRGDSRATAALWTEQGEIHDADGTVIRGRSAIEKAFAEVFKQSPKAQIEVLIEAIRFPSPDVAIEEGIMRYIGTGKELPSTTLYSATHVRVKGKWLIAASQEWGAGQDRLEDLDWLVGTWKGKAGDEQITVTFARDEKKAFLLGKSVRQLKGKVVATGTLRIGNDPETGQLRSWHFDEDGGHGQALWIRDGNRWVLDSLGVQGTGAQTASVNIMSRTGKDELTWRSIDRVMGDQELPDTIPVRLTRVVK